mgnify:CR=1 FL=1
MNIEYTKNSNGFFFNLLDINEDILEKIYKIIHTIKYKSVLYAVNCII